MANVFKQAELEVRKFNSKIIAPQVLEAMTPKLMVEFQAAIEEVQNSEKFKKWAQYMAYQYLQEAVQQKFQSREFRAKLGRAASKLVGGTSAD